MAKSYLQEVLSDSPNTVWKLNEPSGNFADSSGNNLTGTPNGTITRGVSTGFLGVGSGASFAGVAASNVSIGDDPLLRPATALTYETWVKFASIGGANQCAMSKTNQGATDGLGFGITTAGVLFAFLTNTGTTILSGATSLSTGTWYLVAVTCSSSGFTWTLYINGVQDAQITGSGQGPPVPTGTNFNLANDRGSLLPITNGSALCSSAIYPTALSATRLLAHYNARNSLGGNPGQQTSPGQLVAAMAHARNEERKATRDQEQTPTPKSRPRSRLDYQRKKGH